MIYAIRYDNESITRKENVQRQKELSYALLRLAVREVCGREPDFSDIAFGAHGKPYFKSLPIHYNITHTNGLVCLGVHDREVGIDAETLRPYYEKRTDRVCTPEEKRAIEASPDSDLEFIKYWTLKESYVKYTGDGLGYGAKNAAFCYHDGGIKHIGSNTVIYQTVREIEHTLYVVSVCSDGDFDSDFRLLPEQEVLRKTTSDRNN